MIFHQSHVQIPRDFNVEIANTIIEKKHFVKFLGIYIDEKLNWHEHIRCVKNKLNSSIYIMRKTKNLLNSTHLLTLYYSLIYPYLDYGITLWGSTHSSYVGKIYNLQKKTVRIITTSKYNAHTNPLYKKLKILKLEDIYKLKIAKYMYAFDKQILPSPLMNIISYNRTMHEHNTRNKNNPHIDTRRTLIASNSLRHKGPEIWYKIQDITKSKKTLNPLLTHSRNRLSLITNDYQHALAPSPSSPLRVHSYGMFQ
jgi:hypothetical protein